MKDKNAKALFKNILLTLPILLMLIFLVLPYVAMLIMTTHNDAEINAGRFFTVGSHLIENVKAVFAIDFTRYFLNSFYISAITVVFTCFGSAMTAYGLTKFNYKGHNFLFMFVVFLMMIPSQLGLIGFIMEMGWFGWTNTHLPFIVPTFSNAFAVFWLGMYMKGGVPNQVIESARIDGAHEVRIFTKIVIPLIKPALAVQAVQIFISAWNNFTVPSLILSDDRLLTIPVAISKIDEMYSSNTAARITAMVISSFPLLILVVFGSKYFQRGMITGSIKG